MSDLWDKRREGHERIEAEERARQGESLDASSGASAIEGSRTRRLLSDRPALVGAILGAAGGIAGVVVGGILSPFLGVLIGDTALKGRLPEDYGEGLGILVGLYCLVMFPSGGAIVGGLSGALVGAIRRARGERPNPVWPIAVAGLVTMCLTVAGVIAAVIAMAL